MGDRPTTGGVGLAMIGVNHGRFFNDAAPEISFTRRRIFGGEEATRHLGH
jgi:hypothetical protein